LRTGGAGIPAERCPQRSQKEGRSAKAPSNRGKIGGESTCTGVIRGSVSKDENARNFHLHKKKMQKKEVQSLPAEEATKCTCWRGPENNGPSEKKRIGRYEKQTNKEGAPPEGDRAILESLGQIHASGKRGKEFGLKGGQASHWYWGT